MKTAIVLSLAILEVTSFVSRPLLSTRLATTCLSAKKDKRRKDNEEDEENDDDLSIDLSKQDWREFRAKLVMSEHHHGILPAVAGYEECNPESGECDVDGIGELFGWNAMPSAGTREIGPVRVSDPMPYRPERHIDPFSPNSQWAHDSPFREPPMPPMNGPYNDDPRRMMHPPHHPMDGPPPHHPMDGSPFHPPHPMHYRPPMDDGPPLNHPDHPMNRRMHHPMEDDRRMMRPPMDPMDADFFNNRDPMMDYRDPHRMPPNQDHPNHPRNRFAPPSHQSNAHAQLPPSQHSQDEWAYESGNIVEQGSVILGGVEQEFGFGLRQQYFHKAAILVLDHDAGSFTKGIILNRPTDMFLEDDVNHLQWRVWFGGDVQGLSSHNPDIVCLHRIEHKRAKDASVPVMKDIQWTTFENAQKLVKAGVAKPEDFWVFCGYAGWGPGQLSNELERKSWYMLATDSQTLLREMARQTARSDPRDAGLETWHMLMHKIGRGNVAQQTNGAFDDLMLKEWALKHLLSHESGGGAGPQSRPPEGVWLPPELPPEEFPSTEELLQRDPVDRLLFRAEAASRGQDATVGSLVRASAFERSPFLLQDQEFHKSLVLVVKDDENMSVGVILNRPAAKGLDIQISAKDGSKNRKMTLPLRFGGQYTMKDTEPLMWLHCSPLLRSARVGEPIGPQAEGIYRCSADHVTASISQGLASPEDFFVVTGVTVWTKGEGGSARGIQGEIRKGKFEVVPESQTQAVWDILMKQDVLTPDNLDYNLHVADDAWSKATLLNGKHKMHMPPPNGRLGNSMGNGMHPRLDHQHDGPFHDGPGSFQGDGRVFQSNVRLSNLSDAALRSWVATFLLGTPAVGGEQEFS